jgi:dipeptidyl aminopeptidase/acylaminoacyl peptidase
LQPERDLVPARYTFAVCWFVCGLALFVRSAFGQTGPAFTLEQVRNYPFPTELAVSLTGARIAWALDEQGKRNIYAAQGPAWQVRKLTGYDADDGQELDDLGFSADGKWIVYSRGGDHDANWAAEGNLAPDPTSSPRQPKVQIFSIAFEGGEPKLLGEGDEPVVSSRGVVAFSHERAVWTAPVDGSSKAKQLLFARGDNFDWPRAGNVPAWSPDGKQLAFVSVRADHSFIGVYTDQKTPILWLSPSTSLDQFPRWSPDGKKIAFVRTPGEGGAPKTILEQHPQPWSIRVADVASGEARQVWQSSATLRGSFLGGQTFLEWGAGDRLIFNADLDGWTHLYSVSAAGGGGILLTPGAGMVEYARVSPDRRFIVFSGNMGLGRDDIDRRHVFRVALDHPGIENLTPGQGIEHKPFVTGDGRWIAFFAAGAKRPPVPRVISVDPGEAKSVVEDRIPADFPEDSLVVPKAVIFRSSDGVALHGQLFERPGVAEKKPAVVFVHGGPPRQMLLGWHYMSYYANAYAVNQYLASRGYVVLAVNYRLGIGYGHEFQHPDHAGPRGASEYLDVKAAGEYLQSLPQVDGKRIGIWGGSYGGFLTAMALGHDSDLFAAGVDIHGVHDFTVDARVPPFGIEKPSDLERARGVAWQSSPIASVATWRSPVLLIHGDDDRNVRFHQTVDLARRLEDAHVRFEQMVLPDEIHGFLRYASWLKVDEATGAFLDQTIGSSGSGAGKTGDGHRP